MSQRKRMTVVEPQVEPRVEPQFPRPAEGDRDYGAPAAAKRSLASKIYGVGMVIVRTATNALTVPVWAAIAGGVVGLFAGQMVSGFTSGFGAGWAFTFSNPIGWILLVLFGVVGLIHGYRMYKVRSYEGPGGVVGLILDHTWSLPNTMVGALFAVVTAGIEADAGHSQDSSRLILKNGVIGPYDTTFGNVTAGTQVLTHEMVHVIQARITGPFYYPAYVANYALNLIPYWWPIKKIFKIYPKAPIKGIGTYFTRGVYPFVIFEAIAYAVEGSPP